VHLPLARLTRRRAVAGDCGVSELSIAGVDAEQSALGSVVVGSALFGVGWGVAGYCPGPAIVASATGNVSVLVFVSGMVMGTGLCILWERLRRALASNDVSSSSLAT
jgi:uncharacterized membrane protein YedE/YeeE